jgi:hypothetical protein
MKNKTGMAIGFIAGVAGFLFLFKIIILDNTPPSDELAPGIVVMASILNGIILSYIGSLLQNCLRKKKTL